IPIYVKTGATDMRKSVNGLSAIVQEEMKLNPFDKDYFVFCGKTKHILKLLYWDKTGFAMWYKRLEKAKFPWPEKEEEVKKIDAEQIGWLLSGIDFFKAHKKLQFSRV
ncbi:MAG: IS66 family insertion sequence element accessory protein TnpB, partial [Spirochaetia bacterium]